MNEIPPVSRIGGPRRWPWAVGAVVVAGALAWGATHWVSLPLRASPVARVPHTVRASSPPRPSMTTAFAQPWDTPTIAQYDRAAAQDVLTAVAKVYPAFAANGGVVTWQMVHAPAPAQVDPHLVGLPANGSVQGLAAALAASAPGFPRGPGDPSAASIRRAATVAAQWALVNAGNQMLPLYARLDGPASYLGMLDADSFVAPAINGYLKPGLGSLASRSYTYRAWVAFTPRSSTILVGRGDTQLIFPSDQRVQAVVRVVLTTYGVISDAPPGRAMRVIEVRAVNTLLLAHVTTDGVTHWYVLIAGTTGWQATGRTFPA
jgi:hypothetical protein